MSQTGFCSICSHEKREEEGLLPARERYLGSHIAKVEREASQEGLPFFILSGVYGLIPAEEGISYYDQSLTVVGVPFLTIKVHSQLRQYGLDAVHFFTKTKTSWEPYLEALKLATESLGVMLCIHELLEDD